MKKIYHIIITILCATTMSFAQDEVKPKLYDPTADAKADIIEAVKKANQEGKHVLLQLGGNWCVWCIRFDNTVNSNETLKTAMEDNYVVYHVNYSPENLNKEVFEALGFPQRFGFPVFVILDGDGKRLHTQNSAYLEQDKGHSEKKILEFFNAWSPKALDPSSYKN